MGALEKKYWSVFDRAMESGYGEDHPLLKLDQDLDDIYGNLTLSVYRAMRNDLR
ncbi:hypothetical protein [Nocardia nova]|uniref:hypothetical protein n=1 Tax=Nocardia nova TaxID=37330 RepID=UPI002739CABB|nr:hypothetical protein [Nocardia nova]